MKPFGGYGPHNASTNELRRGERAVGDPSLARGLGPLEWRFAALGGATAGLAAAPFVASPGPTASTLAGIFGAVLVLALARPQGRRVLVSVWLALVALVAAAGGVFVGTERVAAIDAGALEASDGSYAAARGFVTAVPRRFDGSVSVRVQTADGRLLIEAPEPVPELPVGREVHASGTLREPAPWQAAYLRRYGIGEVLEAKRIDLTSRRRGGVAALADRVRAHAEAALERGMAAPQAALARGFVLGEDDRIDPATVDDFKRSGLAHLLAVSGQNVLLLALLAVPILAALNLSLRARMICVLALIALYVPVTGAGPSIQRAAVMGAAGIVAALAGRPRSRWYALLLAAASTLAVNPLASGDVGWQLSFAAVAGILLWAEGIREWLVARLGAEHPAPLSWQRALAEGAAVTIAATLATAPLMAHHFESFSITALPANLLALPAVAPVMWLGMLVAIVGQVPAIPVEPLNWLSALLIAYVAQVARWMAAPEWALADLRLSTAAMALAYAGLVAGSSMLGAMIGRRGALRLRTPIFRLVAAVLVLAVAAAAWPPRGDTGGQDADAAGSAAGLEITVLDVGQGDAILLEPPDAEPLLVDGGPPGAEIVERLRDEGVQRLGSVALTHDQLDHAAGVEEVLGSIPVRSLLYARAHRELLADARAAGTRPLRVSEHDTIRAGSLRLDVLWPPRTRIEGPADDPNELSLVMLARWRRFSMLLTGDAEAETAPISPGPVDVLKIAHHGSDDAGLDELLESTVPRTAVISVGEDNPYGHPTAATIATLAQQGIAPLRTDAVGDVQITVEPGGWTAAPE
jgi:competence protein ComEC